MSVSNSPKEILEPHLTTGEDVKITQATRNRSLLGTDRRLLILEIGEHGDRTANRIQSIPFENISSIRIDQVGPESPEYRQVFFGVIAGLLGLWFGWGLYSINEGGSGGILQLLRIVISPVAVALVGYGLYKIYQAFNTDSGHISLKIQAGGMNRQLILPEDDLDTVESLSRVVAEYHDS